MYRCRPPPRTLFSPRSRSNWCQSPEAAACGGRRQERGGRPSAALASALLRARAVLADIAGRLSSYPVLVLQGGTGVGKSIAAIGHAVASASSWGWVDLRGVPAATLAETLDRVVAELATEDGLTHIVLDDIELPVDSRSLETPLARIKTILGGRGGQLVITSAVALPQRLSLALALPAGGTMSIPPFSREEITEFLSSRGCPAPKVAGWWAAFVELHTSGHAQLVHARIATLEAQGFPIPDMQSLMVTPSDVVEARAEARRLITTLDAPTRDFIYRLSLNLQVLPRRQVLAIAGQSPPITEPGLVFDRLVGPWLEMVADGFYRVSPLLRALARRFKARLGPRRCTPASPAPYSGFSTLSPTDVSTILFHATAAWEWSAVAQLSLGLLRSDKETWEALAQSADWFVLMGTGSATRPETDVFSLSLIRLLQLRLAAADHDDEGAASVIACIDELLPATVEGMPLRLARYFFLGQVQLCTEVTLPIAQLVSIGFEYMRLTDELKDVLASVHDPEFNRVLMVPTVRPSWPASPASR